MDAHDLFRQLTCGASFLSNKSRAVVGLVKKNNEQTTIDPIKLENGHGNEVQPSIQNKQEIDNVGPDIHLIDGITTKIKKKKKPLTEEKLKMLECERINQIKNKHHINVTGKIIPPPIQSFNQLQETYQVSQQIIENLGTCGYTEPTPIQMQAIPTMLLGNSVLACAPTGSGKTVAFLVPILYALNKPKKNGFRALILCPTRELAKQTQRECLRLVENIGFRIHVLSKINRAEQRYGDKSNKKFDILITTPQRICYLLEQNPPVLSLQNVKWLILDEADKLFEEGARSFREQFDGIYAACTNEEKMVGLFSATWTNPVAKWLRKNIKNAATITIGQRNAATNLVDQQLLFAGSEPGKLLAFREMLKTGLNPPVLVFVESKERAQQLYSELRNESIHVDVIHSDLTQQQRDTVVKEFREGTCWVLICTELISRGIDFKGVNLVVNYDFPQTPISYIHRIGRTGRAGRTGKAITYFTQSDTIHLKSIAKIIKNSGGNVPEFILQMKDHSKRSKRKMEKEREKREDIRTLNTYGVPLTKQRQKQLVKKNATKTMGKMVSKQPTNYVSLKSNNKRKNDNNNVAGVVKKRFKK